MHPLSWAPCSFGAPRPGGPKTDSPTSRIASSAPSASATPSASAPCSISDATSTFGPMAAALLPTRRHPGRPDAPGRRLPDRRRTRSATRRTVGRPRHARAGTGRRADRHPPVDVDSLRLVSVGVEQVGLWALKQLGLPALLTELGQRRVAHRGGRRRRRASGPAGLRARDPPLAANAQRPRRVAPSTSRPSARCSSTAPRTAGEASRGDRGASVRPRPGPVRPAADRHPLRPDQHLFRRRGGCAAAGGAGTRRRSAATVRC